MNNEDILLAAKEGQLDKVQQWYANQKKQSNLDPAFSMSLLKEASQGGHKAIAKMLIESGIKIPKDWLTTAVMEGDLQTVSCIIYPGCLIDDYGWAVIMASLHGHTAIVKYLLDLGFQLHDVIEMALHEVRYLDRDEIVLLLINFLYRKCSRVACRLKRAGTLEYALRRNNMTILESVIDCGVLKRQKNAALWAVKYERFEMLRYMLKRGAYVSTCDDGALYLAEDQGLTAFAECLRQYGANTACCCF